MLTKTCKTCKKEYPATNEYFRKMNKGKYGIGSQCKVCQSNYNKVYNRINREEKNAHNREYRAQNRERINAHNREYYAKNKEQAKQWREAHREEHIHYVRKWYKENKGVASINCKQYYLKNREKIIKYSKEYGKEYRQKPHAKKLNVIRVQKRYNLMRNLATTLTLEQWDECLIYFNYSCAYCGKSDCTLEQDHIIPVTLGGGYERQNIVPACRTCNPSKSNNNMEKWYKQKPFFQKQRLRKINNWIKRST